MPPIATPLRASTNLGDARAVPARSVRGSVLKTLGKAALTVTLLFALAGPARATVGTFNRAIGAGVNPTGSGGSSEVCTVAADCAVGTNGSAGGAFNDPEGVATDAAGNIWVAETNGQRVQKLGPSGKFLLAIGKNVNLVAGATNFDVCTVAQDCQAAGAGGLNGQFNDPRDVATDAAGDVYVADFLNNRVQKFDSPGNLLSVIGSGGGHGGELDLPTGVTTDAQGNLYVAEEGSNRISKFDSAGHFLFAFGKDVVTGGSTGFEVCTVAASCKLGAQGTLGGELTEPHAVAVDANGNIYVVDSDSHRVEKFDSSGNFLLAFGEDVDAAQAGTGFEICAVAASCKAGLPGDQAGAFNFPEGIATDAAGNAYVSDLENGRIEEFDSSGHLVRVITSSAGGGLTGPAHVSTDAAGDLYVADAGNARIQEFGDALPTGGGTGGTAGGGGTGGTSGAGGSGGTGSGIGTGKPPSAPPRITKVTQSHSTWRAGGKLATFAEKKRPPVGTRFSFVLDQPARVSLAFVQELAGRKLKARCVAPTRANRRTRSRRRQVPVATLTFTAHRGSNQFAFQGRVSRSKRLRPGHYTMLIIATNAVRQRSVPRSLAFMIVS